MELTGAVSRLWSKYAAGSFISVGSNGTFDRSGEAVPQSPEWTFNIGATQTIPFNGGDFRASLSYSYTSSRNMGQDTPDLTNPALTPAQISALVSSFAIQNQFSTLGGYGLLNGKVGVELDNGLELSIWGKNLMEKHYYSSLFNSYTALGVSVQFQGTPRTFGATLGYKF
jgi:iron complex outermembrane receptor protein